MRLYSQAICIITTADMQCKHKLTRITKCKEKRGLSEEKSKKMFEYLLGAAGAIAGAGAAVVVVGGGSKKRK